MIEVTVTVADLDAAIAAKASGQFTSCSQCVMAKALMRATGAPQASVGLSSASVPGYPFLAIPDDVCDLISLFDNEEFDALRQLLPVSFVLEAR